MPTDACRPAWVSRSRITTATAFSISPRPISPATGRRSTATRTAGFFEDVSERAGLGRNLLLGWGIAFLDVDEDGWPDLVIANGHVYPEIDRSPIGETYRQKTLLYRNLGNGNFADITASAGPGFAPARPSRGMATGDLDGDGRPEILIVNMNDRPALLKNIGPRQNAIAITLTGTRSNRSAIGAPMHNRSGRPQADRRRRQRRQLLLAERFHALLRCRQGGKIDRLEVRWPAGEKQSWTAIAPNRTLRITEGKSDFGRATLSTSAETAAVSGTNVPPALPSH